MAKRKTDIGGQPQVVSGQAPFGGGQSSGTGVSDLLTPFISAFQQQSIRDQNAAATSYKNTLKLQAATEAESIGTASENNPQKIRARRDAFLPGFLSNIPDENIRREIGAYFDNALGPFQTKANKNATTLIKARDVATLEAKEGTDNALRVSGSKGVFSDDPGEVTAASDWIDTLRTDLMERLSVQGVDSNGEPFPVFPPGEVAKHLNRFNDTWISSGLRGWVERQPALGTAIVDVMTGKGPEMDALDATGKIVSVRAVDKLSKTAKDNLIADLSSQLKLTNQNTDRAKTASDEKQQRDWDINAGALTENLNTASPEERLNPKEIRFMAENGDLDPSKLDNYITLAVKPRPEFDNAELVKSFSLALDAGVDISELLADPIISAQFKPGTFSSFSAQNQTNLDVAAGIDEGPLKNEISAGLTLLRGSIQTGGVGGSFGMVLKVDNKAVLRRAEAIRLYQIRTAPVVDPDTGRTAPSLERPIDVATDLIQRSLTDFNSSGPGASLLLPLAYKGTRETMTGEALNTGMNEIQRRFDAGVISKKIYDKNSIIYGKWFGLLPEIIQAQQPQTTPDKKGALPPRRTE